MTTPTTTPPAPRPLGQGLRPLGGLRPLARPGAPAQPPGRAPAAASPAPEAPPVAAPGAPPTASPAPEAPPVAAPGALPTASAAPEAPPVAAPGAPPTASAAPEAPPTASAAPEAPPASAPAKRAAPKAKAAPPAPEAAAASDPAGAIVAAPRLAERGASPWAGGAYRPRAAEVKLPEVGSRMTLETTKELWHRYVLAHAADLGLDPASEPTKEFTQGLMMVLIDFLFGPEVNSKGTLPLPPATVESIVQGGGLARLFGVRLRGDVAFGIERIGERVFPNPRKEVPAGTLIRISNRAHVKLTYLSEAGLSEAGRKIELEPGTEPVFVADEVQIAAEAPEESGEAEMQIAAEAPEESGEAGPQDAVEQAAA